jgi:hypothetical protein
VFLSFIIGVWNHTTSKVTDSTVQIVHVLTLKDSGTVDLDLFNRLVATAGPDAAKLVNDVLTLHNLAKHGVLAVEVRGRAEGDEELAAIGARARVGHAERALAVVPERRNELVLELAAVDGGAAAASTGGVTTLDHETLDDAVEDDIVVFAGCG